MNQIELRDQIAAICLPHLDGSLKTTMEVAAACMGACAIVLGILPPRERETTAEMVADSLLDHANKRAAEIRSGALDRRFQN